MKKFLSLIAVFAIVMSLSIGLTSCSDKAKTGTGDTNKPKLVLGLDASFPPMGFKDKDNKIVGVDIDIAQAVCDKIGYTLEPKPIAWSSKEQEIATDKIDCIWNGFTVTPQRAEELTLSFSYMNNEQVIVVMNDSPIAKKADLEGKLVMVQSDSSGLVALQKDPIAALLKDGKPRQVEEYVTALNDLKVGRCDAIVMDSVVANYYIKENAEDMKVLEEAISSEEYAIGFKKGNTELKEKIEKALKELKAEGKITEISNKWFGKPNMINIPD